MKQPALVFTVRNSTQQPLGVVTLHHGAITTQLLIQGPGDWTAQVPSPVHAITIYSQTSNAPGPTKISLPMGKRGLIEWQPGGELVEVIDVQEGS